MEFRAITPLGGICIWNPGAVPSQAAKQGWNSDSLLFQNAPSHFHGKVAEPGDSATWDDSNLWIA
jgi:hypothetical protein